MEDIYDDLENYQDEKLIKELKLENQGLKIKLEEYSSAMAQLQKDFDKLNSEYKKLETNYSSLLKTARAEIERKSVMIKNLNVEKDTLVLSTLQRTSGKDYRAKTQYDFQKPEESSGTFSQGAKATYNKEPAANKDKYSYVNKRLNSTHTPEGTTDKNSCEDNELMNHKNNIKNDLTEPTEIIEEHKKYDDINYDTNKKPLIRRKLPPSQVEPIFSSDDDFEALTLKYSKYSPARDARNIDVHHRNKDNKPTESLDSYDSCSKSYRNKKGKSPGNGAYKHEKYYFNRKQGKHHNDRYNMQRKEKHQSNEEYSKHRVLRSPPTDKYNRSKSRDRRGNYDREYHHDYNRQSPHHYDNYGTKHKLRSDFDEPSCKRQKTSDHNRERTSLRDNFTSHSLATPCQQFNTNSAYTMESQDIDKETKTTTMAPFKNNEVSNKKFVPQRNQAVSELPVIDKCNAKSNLPLFDMCNSKSKNEDIHEKLVNTIYMDLDKPALDTSPELGEIQSSISYTIGSKDKQKIEGNHKKCDNNKNIVNLQVNDQKRSDYKIPKIKFSHENHIPNKKPTHSQFSIDNPSTSELQHVDTGIKHSHSAPIESTKVSSSTPKHVTEKHLTKTELPVIDKPEPDLPLLDKFNDKLKKSAVVTEELVNEIYMDLNNPELNSSLEEGEIPSSKDFTNFTKDCQKLDEQKPEGSHRKYDNIKIINSQLKNSKSSDYKDSKSDSNKVVCSSHAKKSINSDYKIQSPHENCVTDKNDNLDDKITSKDQDFKENTKTSVDVEQSKSNGSNSTNQNYLTQSKEENINDVKGLEEMQNSLLLFKETISMNTLAGDLELSDEVSDNKDSQNHDSKSKHIRKTKKKLNNREEDSELNLNKNENRLSSLQGDIKVVESKDKKSKKTSDKKSPKDTESKHKSRKKAETICQVEKMTKSKKQNKDGHEKKHVSKNKECKDVKSQQTISKFTDLFGDSCSLITPDDLGMPLQDVKLSQSNNVPYVPIFDNTQDAVDLNVEELTKEKCNSVITNMETIKENLSKDKKSSNSIISIFTKEDGDNNVTNIKQPLNNNHYENTISQTFNDGSNVVKTIIISTGVQPQCVSDSNLTFQRAQNDGVNNGNINIVQSNVKKSSLNRIQALATSTPHKTSSELHEVPKESVDTTIATATEEISISSNPGKELANNESDEPDVRIFVKRRRKVIKKV